MNIILTYMRKCTCDRHNLILDFLLYFLHYRLHDEGYGTLDERGFVLMNTIRLLLMYLTVMRYIKVENNVITTWKFVFHRINGRLTTTEPEIS